MRVTASDIVTAARQFEGAPYRHLGRSALGMDCLGLFLVAGWETGLVPRSYDRRDYGRRFEDYRLIEEFEASGFFERLPRWEEARAGDAILQKFHLRYPASHCLLVTKAEGGYWWAQHASSLGGARVITQRVGHHERCFAGFRFKEVA